MFLLLLGVFMQATGQVPQFWFLPCIAVSILIMYLYIRMQADVPGPERGVLLRPRVYFGGTGRLAGMAALLLYGRAAWHAGRGCARGHFGSRLCRVYGVVFALERNYNDIAAPLHVHKKEFLSTLFIGVAVYAASNLSYVSPDTPFSGKMTAEIYNTARW